MLVHGTTASKDMWAFVVPELEADHAVHVYDRRGRGESDLGTAGYGLDAEIDDLRSILEACDGPPHLVAHSFGAVCALEAAATGSAIASLTIYEPPVRLATEAAAVADARAHLTAGHADRALEVFLPLAGSPSEEVQFLQSMPEVWGGFVAVAEATLDRELQAMLEFTWEPDRYDTIDAPTLILAGELTDAAVYPTPAELQAALPHARTHVFPGQRHVAMSADPGAFTAAVRAFLTDQGS